MAGMSKETPIPDEVKLHRVSRVLELVYGDQVFRLPAEYLRVFTPSAEARGHAPGQEVLQIGKRLVEITGVEPVGSYALKLVFSDGHDSGLYSWDYLYQLGENRDDLWQTYLVRLEAEGGSRDPADLPPPAPKAGGCGHH